MGYSKRDLTPLSEQEFDVAIIGGGITGAWLALHCVQQGFKTALVERADYASSTSSASSKLLHGGIRYLQQFQFDKVRESAMERAEYLYAAPHLSTPVPFVVPTYPDFKRSKLFLNCGMLAYRLLCLGENKIISSSKEALPSNFSINRTTLNTIFDLGDESHTGGVVFYERHMVDSERMVLAIIQTARKLGAIAHNYVNAKGFLGDDNTVTGIKAHDELNGHDINIRSKLVINAAGPFIDNLNATLRNAETAPSINGFEWGSHIITRQLCDHAIALTTEHKSDAKVGRGGTHAFVIPWRGHSLIGTSYTKINEPNGDISIPPEHVNLLLQAVNKGMPSAKLTHDDVISGYSGLLPIHTNNIKSTVYQGSGEYQIIDHQQANQVAGLITALGAKFTTGRKISALTMSVVEKKLGRSVCIDKTKLSGSGFDSFNEFSATKRSEYKTLLPATTLDHLIRLYGSDIDDFIQSIKDTPELYRSICATQPDILGQVAWAVQHEQAHTLDDILYGRTSLGLLGIQTDELEPIADLMTSLLSWSASEKLRQLDASKKRLEKNKAAISA